MLSSEDIRFASEDVRMRQAALVALIDAMDKQALGLLQLYLTIVAAASSGAGAIVLATGDALPKSLISLLIFLALPLCVGAICCLIAFWSSAIGLPGRGPEFWLWALDPRVNPEDAFRAYLESLSMKIEQNRRLNEKMALWLYRAKCCAAITPFCAVLGLFYGIALRL